MTRSFFYSAENGAAVGSGRWLVKPLPSSAARCPLPLFMINSGSQVIMASNIAVRFITVFITVKPVLRGHPGDPRYFSLNRGVRLVQVHFTESKGRNIGLYWGWCPLNTGFTVRLIQVFCILFLVEEASWHKHCPTIDAIVCFLWLQLNYPTFIIFRCFTAKSHKCIMIAWSQCYK